MVRVAIISKPLKEALSRLLPELVEWLRQHGYEPLLDRESGQYATAEPVVDRAEMPALKPELVIVLGGDGTLLSVARIFAATGTPILGVNLGFLGFLTEIRLADLFSTLEGWCSSCYDLDARVMLHAERLSFIHPTSRKRLDFHAPLPPDFVAVEQALRKMATSVRQPAAASAVSEAGSRRVLRPVPPRKNA